MTRRNTPPKHVKRKLNAEARAELGLERICEACDEPKPVSEKTYTPNNKGLRGWSVICKVCEALGHKAVSKRLKDVAGDGGGGDVEEMYFLSFSQDERCREIAERLGAQVRKLAEKDRRASFMLFVDICKPLIANWVEPGQIHDDIIDGLMSQHKRRLIIATRFSAKSTLTAVYVAWRIFLDPMIKIMVISRTSKLAARMLRTVRAIFLENCPVLAHLKPTEDCLDNAEQFQVPQTLAVTTGGATFTSLGITSNLPGYRSDVTIGDDVEGQQDDTPEKIEALHEALNELHMINPKGEKVMLGTYQSEFSIYAKLADLQERNGKHIWELHRACMFEEDVIDGEKVIHSRWPEMFDEETIYDWRSSVTERGWRLHAMLIADPSILHERPLKISMFILADWNGTNREFPVRIEAGVEPRAHISNWGAPKGDVWRGARTMSRETSPYVQTIVGVDPASGLAGRDAIGVAVLGITASGHGVIRHLEGVRGANKMGNIRRVAIICAEFSAQTLVVEELADGLFGETLEGQLMIIGHPMTVEKVTTGNQMKGRRIIESLEPPMAVGRIVMLEHVAASEHGGEFVNQLVRVSYDGRTGKAKQHDDIVDALAHAIAKAKSSLISSVSDNLGAHEAAKVDRLRRMPIRFGGLGDTEDRFARTRRLSIGGLDREPSLIERLVGEDETLAKLIARRDAMQEQMISDMTCGMSPSPRIRMTIMSLNRQIEELKECHVL